MKAFKKPKHFLLVYIVVSAISLSAVGQQYRIIPFVGYTLKESFDFAGKQGVIKENMHYGGIFEFRIKRNYSIELLFQQQETDTEFSDTISHRVINTVIDWYMVGGLNYHQFGKSRFSSIAGLYVGVGNVKNQDNNANSARFAAGLKAGVVYDITKSIGIRVQPQCLLMLGGPGHVWGVDNVGTYGTIVQAAFSGGIIFSFGNKSMSEPAEGL